MKVVGPSLNFPTIKNHNLIRSRTQVMVKILNNVRMGTMLEKIELRLKQNPIKKYGQN